MAQWAIQSPEIDDGGKNIKKKYIYIHTHIHTYIYSVCIYTYITEYITKSLCCTAEINTKL